MRRRDFVNSTVGSALLVGMADPIPGITLVAEAESGAYRAEGTFLEGCTCSVVCPCALSGSFGDGCHGASALVLTSAVYEGKELGAVKLAWAGHAGNWSHLYVDAPAAQRDVATAFVRALYGPMGKIEAVKSGSIDLSGRAGRFQLTIEGGRVLDLSTEPVLGGDKTTPISHTNTFIPWSPTVQQARTIKASFRDQDRSFAFEASNSFFNDALRSSGKLSA
jgi:hypothetical protein